MYHVTFGENDAYSSSFSLTAAEVEALLVKPLDCHGKLRLEMLNENLLDVRQLLKHPMTRSSRCPGKNFRTAKGKA